MFYVYQPPRNYGKSLVVWILELEKIVESLEKNQKVVWDVDAVTARKIASLLGVKHKLIIRADNRSFKSVLRLR